MQSDDAASSPIALPLIIRSCFADLSTPAGTPDAAMTELLKYYSPEVHKAAFVLPVFAEKQVAAVRRRLVKEKE